MPVPPNLTPGTYTQIAEAGPSEAGAPGPQFMDITISRENLLSGEMVRRFDTKAFPQVGKTLSGTDSDGNPFPRVAKPCNDGTYN